MLYCIGNNLKINELMKDFMVYW